MKVTNVIEAQTKLPNEVRPGDNADVSVIVESCKDYPERVWVKVSEQPSALVNASELTKAVENALNHKRSW